MNEVGKKGNSSHAACSSVTSQGSNCYGHIEIMKLRLRALDYGICTSFIVFFLYYAFSHFFLFALNMYYSGRK